MYRRFAGVGSRKIPPHMAALMYQIGRALCDQHWKLSGADAIGSDQAFQEGVRSSPCFKQVGFELFMPGLDRDRFKHAPEQGIYNAKLLPNYEQAQEIAFKARGSFDGLNDAGVALHSRNPYQILGLDLASPVDAMVFYAEPIEGKSRVAGGTNTAYQIALEWGIRTINLYTPEGLEAAEAFLRALPNPPTGAV